MGDFKLVYNEQDKNSGQLDRSLMHRFRRALNHIEIREVLINGRKFTWSNKQANPTMSRIDRAFCTVQWEHLYAKPNLQALSSTSDHNPFLLLPLETPAVRPRFRFESFWKEMPGFYEVVSQAWNRQVQTSLNRLSVMHAKMSKTAKALKFWAKSLLPQSKIAMAVCREVILQLETAQEFRPLSQEECAFMSKLKSRIMGLTTIEKCRTRQKLRITWLKKGDANTRFFNVMANIKTKSLHSYPLQR
jgi:hypothetical protein